MQVANLILGFVSYTYSCHSIKYTHSCHSIKCFLYLTRNLSSSLLACISALLYASGYIVPAFFLACIVMSWLLPTLLILHSVATCFVARLIPWMLQFSEITCLPSSFLRCIHSWNLLACFLVFLLCVFLHIACFHSCFLSCKHSSSFLACFPSIQRTAKLPTILSSFAGC